MRRQFNYSTSLLAFLIISVINFCSAFSTALVLYVYSKKHQLFVPEPSRSSDPQPGLCILPGPRSASPPGTVAGYSRPNRIPWSSLPMMSLSPLFCQLGCRWRCRTLPAPAGPLRCPEMQKGGVSLRTPNIPIKPPSSATSHLCGREATVRVLLLCEPANNAGGVIQIKVCHRLARKKSQQHVGGHLHLKRIQACSRSPGSFPVSHSICHKCLKISLHVSELG